MGVANENRVTARWKIAKLKDHPRQAEMFGDVDEAELETLAENMTKHGLRDPVHITPDGTVITGHQRVRAAKQLGWTEIDVVIRHDLAEAGADAIEEHFVEDNFIRRQLSPLSRARCIRRLMEIGAKQASSRFGIIKKEELKAMIGRRMNIKPRSVSRYLLVLDAPATIQRAFDRGVITLIAAGKVALLSKKVQAEIVGRIDGGEKPASVIAEYLNEGKSDDATRAFVRVVSCLRRELPSVRGQVSQIPRGRLASARPTLRDAIAALTEFAAEPVQKQENP